MDEYFSTSDAERVPLVDGRPIFIKGRPRCYWIEFFERGRWRSEIRRSLIMIEDQKNLRLKYKASAGSSK